MPVGFLPQSRRTPGGGSCAWYVRRRQTAGAAAVSRFLVVALERDVAIEISAAHAQQPLRALQGPPDDRQGHSLSATRRGGSAPRSRESSQSVSSDNDILSPVAKSSMISPDYP